MSKYIMFILIILGASLLGYFFYSSFSSGDLDMSDFCEQNSDCPVINCIRSPCPYNICENNKCELVVPREAVCRGDAGCFYGKVTKIVDGDTIDVDGTRIRLAIVNTPEIDEEGYQAARSFVERTCPVGSDVLVDEDDLQTGRSYGRVIAEVHCGKTNLNEALLESNLAKIDYLICDDSEFADEKWADSRGC